MAIFWSTNRYRQRPTRFAWDESAAIRTVHEGFGIKRVPSEPRNLLRRFADELPRLRAATVQRASRDGALVGEESRRSGVQRAARESEASASARALARSAALRILVCGGYGPFQNLGDEAILRSVVRRLRRLGNVDLAVGMNDPSNFPGIQGCSAVPSVGGYLLAGTSNRPIRLYGRLVRG